MVVLASGQLCSSVSKDDSQCFEDIRMAGTWHAACHSKKELIHRCTLLLLCLTHVLGKRNFMPFQTKIIPLLEERMSLLPCASEAAGCCAYHENSGVAGSLER